MKITSRFSRPLLAGAAVAGLLMGFAGVAEASHAWADYHWARSSNPFTLKLGNNVGSAWGAYLAQASTDWSLSTVLDTTVVAGSVSPRTCKTVAGTVQVCDSKYGNTGWLGLASITIDSAHHITKGYVKLNDTYFNTATYNTPGWRQMVTCQEVGHTFGLTHQDENFNNANLGTCMDYTNDPNRDDGAGNNLHPNQHDYDELVTIYTHLDSYTTIKALVAKAAALATTALAKESAGSEEFGRATGYDAKGRADTFEKDLAGGAKEITHVLWLPE